jgi:hypothetical protein
MGKSDDQPTFANGTRNDTEQSPSIETTPGTIPQRPDAAKAPSRRQAEKDDEGSVRPPR